VKQAKSPKRQGTNIVSPSNFNATNTKSIDSTSNNKKGGFTQAQQKKQQSINGAIRKVDTLNLDLSGKEE
jgi:hypothetical protein